MVRASWKGKVIAESAATVIVEGNHYFPADAVHREFVRESETHSVCPWKGRADYLDVVVDGEVNADAAWTYPQTKPEAKEIEGHIAFWKGIEIEE